MLAYLRFAPWILVAIAIGAALLFRGDKIKAEGDREAERALRRAAEANLATAEETNAANARNIERMLIQAQETDRLIADLIETQQTIAASLEETRNDIATIQESDPVARAWADEPIPDSLLGTLNRGGGTPRRQD